MLSLLSTALLALSATTAFSFPLSGRQSTGYTMFISSTNPLLDGRAINASDTDFWVGKETNFFCPVAAPGCANFPNVTAVQIGNDAASMYAVSPGGQDVFVANPGTFQFTDPHLEGEFPPGAYTTGFEVVGGVEGAAGELKFTNADSTGWYVCGDGSAPAQVFAKVESTLGICADAQDVRIFLNEIDETGAFQYD